MLSTPLYSPPHVCSSRINNNYPASCFVHQSERSTQRQRIRPEAQRKRSRKRNGKPQHFDSTKIMLCYCYFHFIIAICFGEKAITADPLALIPTKYFVQAFSYNHLTISQRTAKRQQLDVRYQSRIRNNVMNNRFQHHQQHQVHCPLQLSSSATPTTTSSPSQQQQHQLKHPIEREIFSVAPMMGHTNKHYRYFYRLLSRYTHLYTEMVPSSQIVRAYKRTRDIYLKQPPSSRRTKNEMMISPEEVLEVYTRYLEKPHLEGYGCGKEQGDDSNEKTLFELVGLSPSSVGEYPVTLQLGGRNPTILGAASMIGAVFGRANTDSNGAAAAAAVVQDGYQSVNLNCGCPSNAVGGRSGGAVLMKDPSHVATIVEHMNQNLQSLSEVQADDGRRVVDVTVKHRLGIHDASTYDVKIDSAKSDAEAFQTCQKFVKTVTLNGDVTKCHVHARLGLLGEFLPEDTDENNHDDMNDLRRQRRQSLWVPGQEKNKNINDKSIKIDHKREQQRARKRAREATMKNRSVPPLRPGVVDMLADEFPQLEFVKNGGIKCFSDVCDIAAESGDGGSGGVVGSMVGRAVINHPCAFAAVDKLWKEMEDQSGGNGHYHHRPTRGEVLQDYIHYCDREEERIRKLGASPQSIKILRSRLVAVPFHLFMGEDGNDAFQRRLRKLTSKTVSLSASSILSGAASFVPVETLNKCVDDFVPLDDIPIFDGYRRSSAMQRMIF